MEDPTQSPPKRITRARAAAKDTAQGLKTAKIATASSKAKVTRSVSTTKRKTRSDDTHEDEEQQPQSEEIIELKTRSTRRRPKKTVEPEPEPEMNEPPVRATRAKKPIVEAAAPETVAPRATRGRGAKKIEVPEEDAIVVEEPPKRIVRTRATTATKAAPKKSVKFEEPDKENVVPITANAKGKAKATEPVTGLRAKPVRKPAAPTRTTRGRAKSVVEEEEQRSSPLSPKKATQVSRAKEAASEDELATTEKTPMKPLMKSPVKPPGSVSVFGTAKKVDFSTTITANRAVMPSAQDLKGSIVASPARRPPQSPFKESMKTSPRGPGLSGSMLKSPFKMSLPAPKSAPENSPFKASLLQSPARRPQSPTKVTETGSPTRSTSTFAVTPKASTFKISRFATPRAITHSDARPGQMLPPPTPAPANVSSTSAPAASTNEALSVEPSLTFSGRLSSIMPREVDPAFTRDDTIQEEPASTTGELIQEQTDSAPQGVENEEADDRMEVDELDTMTVDQPDAIVVDNQMDGNTTTPPCSPPRESTGIPLAFALRETNESPFHDSESESEDELASLSPRYSPIPLTGFKTPSHDIPSSPSTPNPFIALSKTPKTAARRSKNREKIGFTPLATQLSNWMAASPAKSESNVSEAGLDSPLDGTFAQAVEAIAAQPSPAKSTFFEDEMSVRDELAMAPEPPSLESDLFAENFEPVEIDDEDMALANEADEMSLLQPDEIEAPPAENMFSPEEEADGEEQETDITVIPESQEAPQAEDIEQQDAAPEPALSEASQEYSDENDIPIDPALLALPDAPQPPTPRVFATPKRVLSERVCHTVSKVPLKPAADHTPMRPSPLKRSASISRLPARRPSSTLTRKDTVISYSSSKSTPRRQVSEQPEDVVMQDTLATPSKSDAVAWSIIGTPARTPRRDLNTSLLTGAVVFVDVYTSEGADASALFTELLSQMGARCVKSWSWNGNLDDKVGITHLVFKDGGKRTLEKAKETNGVVTCVGVGWVLDCERENKWLDESAYAVDTTMVPRGGHRRRKSMEPRALANLNGTLIPSSAMTPGRKPHGQNMSPTKEFLNLDTPVTSKNRRRESVQWVRSPSSSSENNNNNDQTLILSPIPATPAPEAISAYGEDGLYGDETPGGQTPYFLHKEQLVQKTAPAGRRYVETEEVDAASRISMGTGFLSEKKDESVMIRLMAARRKSLQWAPKVGSPLARGELF